MLTETNNLYESSNKKFSRFLVYLISIGIFFVSSLLLLFVLPLVIISVSDLLSYIAVIAFSVIFYLLFKFLLDKSDCRITDYIILPVILSAISALVFGFLKYMELSFQFINKFAGSLGSINSYSSLISQSSIPSTDLLFILFMILFNLGFIYKYLQNSNDKKYFFLYLIPIFCYFLISFAIMSLLDSSVSMGLISI